MIKKILLLVICIQVLVLNLIAQSGQSANSFVLSSYSLEQKDNIFASTKPYRYSLMVNGGGPNIFGSIAFGAMISDFANVEVGLAIGKFHVGASVFIKQWIKNPDFTPYIGAHWSYFEEFMGPTTFPLYFPAGIRYLNERGYSLSFELAYLVSDSRFFLQSPVWGGIKFGKYF